MTDWMPIEQPLPLLAGLVHIVRVSLDLSPDQVAALSRELLSDDERQKAARYRVDDPRRQFVACRSTLRRLIGEACQIPPRDLQFEYGAHGKPELSQVGWPENVPRIEFSVSHSGQLGLIALTIDSAVGVDIEQRNPRVKALKLADRFFAASESQELVKLPAERLLDGFYKGWTCKEAYIKATGQGLSLSLSSFRVSMDPDHPVALIHVDGQPDAARHWTVQSLAVGDGHSASIMVRQPNCRFQCWAWSSEQRPE
ncbi:4'-phosphopantetheinyl transferase superfamily protein [Schlesneria paludicola]|uniref:4'-phosphopantetheinyl transferase superfamily protein n=1 Tax=Schlesneria paludicola TaxID=360056 RepID=UPI00031A22C2|nr:4'-phosphopantetheinyl transferase superfamily protein [Schlesneria paludicola]